MARTVYPNARGNAPRASTSKAPPPTEVAEPASLKRKTRTPRASDASGGSIARASRAEKVNNKAADKPRSRKRDSTEHETAKKLGKRRAAISNEVVPLTRRVSGQTVAKSWRALSESAQSSLRATLAEAALDTLSELDLKHRATVQALLSRIDSAVDRELGQLLVPSSGFLSRPTGVAGSSSRREVELLEEEDMHRRIFAWDHALVQENAGILKLKRALKSERRALEEDEARLAGYEDARLKVEQKEQRDASRALHPLVAELMRQGDEVEEDELGLLGGEKLARRETSGKWIAEAAATVTATMTDRKPLRGPDGDLAEEEEEQPLYDAAADPFLVALQARLSGPLSRLEDRLEGVALVRGALDQAERAVIDLI